jgi:hypothetical protein
VVGGDLQPTTPSGVIWTLEVRGLEVFDDVTINYCIYILHEKNAGRKAIATCDTRVEVG